MDHVHGAVLPAGAVREARFRSKINLFRTQSFDWRVNPDVKPADVRYFTVGRAVADQRTHGAVPSIAREPPEGQRHD